MTKFNKNWKKSQKPNKQRKYRFEAPKHVRGKFMHANLSKDLQETHNTRRTRVREGDIVRVMRGDQKGKEGQVVRVDMKKTQVFIEGIEHTKKEGPMLHIPIRPSNLRIVELNMDDSKRVQKMERYV